MYLGPAKAGLKYEFIMIVAATISPDQFGEIFRRDKEKFVSIARSYVRDAQTAEDIVAEAFTRFWNNREDIELTCLPDAYIMKTVKNMCLNHMRDKLTRLRISTQINNDRLKAMETEINFLSSEDLGFLFESEVASIFRNVMEQFPELTRNIFYASRFEGMTYQEIAAVYGVSTRKVKRDITKVLSLLRISLKDYLHIGLIAMFLGL